MTSTEADLTGAVERLHAALVAADLRVEVLTGTGSDYGRFTDDYNEQLRVLAKALLAAGMPEEVDPWADVPQVGTIAYYRYIGDGEAERDLLSQMLRGMARRVGHVRRYGVAAIETTSKRWAAHAASRSPHEHIAVDSPGVLWMAMRYAVGRSTYAVGECVEAIERHADELPAAHRERMASEIEQAGVLTAPIDGPYWARAVVALRGAERAR